MGRGPDYAAQSRQVDHAQCDGAQLHGVRRLGRVSSLFRLRLRLRLVQDFAAFIHF